MGIVVLTPAASFPVTLAEAKAQCRVLANDEDALIEGLIAAATNHAEQYCGRAFITQSFLLALDCFTDAIVLPRGPVQSITSFQYYDAAGLLQTVDPAIYTLDNTSNPAWIVLNTGDEWPVTLEGVNTVRITFVAGTAAAPAAVKQAILLLVGHWFQHREAVGPAMTEVPLAVGSLLSFFRTYPATV